MTGVGEDDHPAALLTRALGSDASAVVVVRQVRIDASTALLWPQEAAAVAHAAPRRQAEFSAGRAAAHAALADLCGDTGPVLARADRSPAWPSGVVGSISHDDEWAVAAVALQSDVIGLGIDIDIVARFDADLEPLLCAQGERQALLDRHPPELHRERLSLMFCVKEAVYKAQFPLTQAWLDFTDLALTLPAGSSGAYTATLGRAAGGFAAGHVFRGGCAVAGIRAAAALVLRRRDIGAR